MFKVIAVAGEPGTGKSTLFRKLIEEFMQRSQMLPTAAGLAVGEMYPSANVIVLGTYAPAHDFPGTDRLSMAAQSHCIEYITSLSKSNSARDITLLFEGDRLSNISFFEALQSRGVLFEIYVITAPEAVLAERRAARGSNQKPAFLKGRATKLKKLQERFSCHVLPNVTLKDQKALVTEILAKVGITQPPAATAKKKAATV